jgi:hypothetical protein
MPENAISKIKNRVLAVLRLPRNRPYLISFLILIFAAILIGLDNPTGIIVGWLAVSVWIIGLAHKWWTPWYFLILIAGSFVGAIVLSFLYMVVAMNLARWIGGPNATDSTAWHVFHMVISNLILLVVPMGLFYGVMGFIVLGAFRLFRFVRRKVAGRST